MFKRDFSLFLIIAVLFPAVLCSGQQDLVHMRELNPQMPEPMKIDEERVAANGILRIEGKHVVLYTDLREQPEIVELVKVFDRAVPLWCEYFEVDPEKANGWQVSAFVIGEKDRFIKAKLFPDDLPEFPAGFNLHHHMWIYLQPGDYYTRHLVLHEGTHSFMQWFLRGSGPPWYSEGMAELLAVHRWADGELQLNYNLRSKEEAAHWGRVKIIREDVAEGNSRSLEDVFRMPNQAFRSVRNYAWAWAACKFFGEHPLSRAQFAELESSANDLSREFSIQFYRAVKNDWPQLKGDWELFLAEMDYGIQISQLSITEVAGEGGDVFSIDTTRGWQKSTVTVEKGKTYQINASGRFQVALDGTTPWPCEPGGVTIEYFRGHPLGMLMAGVVSGDEGQELGGLLEPTPIGLKGTFTATQDGKLCFRINESAAKLDDNSGSVIVRVSQ